VARIFLAVPLSGETIQNLGKVKEANEHVEKIVWMRTHNLHLTVYFIGQVERANTGEIMDRVKPILEKQTAFDLALDSFCLAPDNKPRMVWARFHRNAVFTGLVNAIRTSIKDLIPDNSFFYEDPIPHITLARFNSTFDTRLLAIPTPSFEKLSVNGCELWESVPAPRGVKYESREKFEF
jgi:2'-5' RNA ligase